MVKKLYFKEHGKLDMFGPGDAAPFELSKIFRVKLLCVSNAYGFAVVGFKNGTILLYFHLASFVFI